MSPAAAKSAEPIRLGWVLVDGRLRAVVDFLGVPAARRPAAHCPVCQEPVVLRLGRVLAPHAAHQPTSRCPLQHEETALHYNTKHHLAAALRAALLPPRPVDGPVLRVRLRCAHRGGVLGLTRWAPGLVPCPALLEEPLAAGWDAVEVEAGLSDVRPDVLLRAAGRPVAALEVRRTHALTAAKIERLAGRDLAWAEVVASRALYAEFGAWDAGAPLTVLRTHVHAGWACDAHRERLASGHRTPPEASTWAVRVIDRYLPGGDSTREVLLVVGTVRGARVREPALRWRADDAPLAVLADDRRDRVLEAAHAAFLAWAAERRAAGERIDSPMSWLPARALGSDDDGWSAGTGLFPRRWRFDAATRRWTRRDGVGARPWTAAEWLGETPVRAGRGTGGAAPGCAPAAPDAVDGAPPAD